MKKALVIIFLLACVPWAYALEWQTCLEYKFQSAPLGSWSLIDEGRGVQVVAWKLTNAIPTQAELAAIEPQAIAWKAARDKDTKSDYETWANVDKDAMIALVKVLLDEINLLRTAAGLQTRTPAQLKAAIRAELN